MKDEGEMVASLTILYKPKPAALSLKLVRRGERVAAVQ